MPRMAILPRSARSWLCLPLVAALFVWGCGRVHVPFQGYNLEIRKEVEAVLAGGSAGIGVVAMDDTVLWPRLAAFYDERHRRPVWSAHNRPRHEAEQLLAAIDQAREAGLTPNDYGIEMLRRLFVFAQRTDSGAVWRRPRTLARFDVRATYAYLRLADDLRHGRVRGDTLDADWRRPDEEKFWKGLLAEAGHEDPRAVLAGLEPHHEDYLRLKSALAGFRAIEAAGGWAEIPPGPPIGRGERGRRVARLVRRLSATGELRGTVADTVMDARLERAVGDFQSRNGIPRSGLVGEATRKVLNVPVSARIRELELNLERWRWLPAELGPRHVRVNIPAFRLDLVREGRIERSLRVVVGKRRSPTPVFSATLNYLEVNPTWTVPPTLVFKELVPAMKHHRDYLAEHGMFVTTLGTQRDTLDSKEIEEIEWSKLYPDSFPYLVVQSAGPENPLGRIKLMCPNEYDIYLHDTPQRERFIDAARDYSHGCVRVSEAIELADSLLGLAVADTMHLDSLTASGQWRRIRFPQRMPVHFLYWTAWADSGGAVNFRPDIYGLDQRLDRALRDRGAPFALNPGVTLSPYWLAAKARAEARRRGARSLAVVPRAK